MAAAVWVCGWGGMGWAVWVGAGSTELALGLDKASQILNATSNISKTLNPICVCASADTTRMRNCRYRETEALKDRARESGL